MKFAELKKQMKNYIQDESGALTVIELVSLVAVVIILVGFVVAWLWDMIQNNTSKGTNSNNNFNNIIDGIQ